MNRRILIIDDSESVHEAMRKILVPTGDGGRVDELRAAVLGNARTSASAPRYEIDSAFQGAEGLDRVHQAVRDGRPYALVILDIRMPPGWDGVATLELLWQADPNLLAALCSAYSDYSWEDINARFGRTDRLMILCKPFEPMEFRQLVCAMIEKWNLAATVDEQLAEVREAGRLAREGSEAKSEFLANVSHEIRTPLNGVMGMLELLRRSELVAEQRRFVDTAARSADLLRCLIDDVLDMSKIEAGKLELESVDFDLGRLVDDVVGQFAADADTKDIGLSVVVHPAVRRLVRGDPLRIRQVLINLVTNAIKFTSDGGVVVRCAPDLETIDLLTIRFTVNDTGIGIPGDRIDRLFQAFSQIDGSTSRHYGGTGLGLAICKKLIALMGGDIGVESNEGSGSTFWFTVAFPKLIDNGYLPQLLHDGVRGLQIIVADHHTEVVTAVRSYFQTHDMAVRTCTGGREAIELLSARTNPSGVITVMFVGHELSDMDHREFARLITADESLGDLVMVLIEPEDEAIDVERLRDLGFCGNVIRPLEPSSVFDGLAAALASAGSKAAPNGDRSAPEAVASMDHRTSRAEFRVLLVEDNAINRDVAESLVSMAGFCCASATTGDEAVERFMTDRYDLILMDCQMPGMDGYEATRRIRALERAEKRDRTPIIALTANALKGDQERCLEAGMDDYLTKPVVADRMISMIDEHLPIWGASDGAGDPAPPPSSAAETIMAAPFDVDDLTNRCMGNHGLVDRALSRFREGIRAQVEQLEASLAEDDHVQLAAVAHSIKGASANLSAAGVRDAAARLESSAKSDERDGLCEQIESLKTQVDRCLDAIPGILSREVTS